MLLFWNLILKSSMKIYKLFDKRDGFPFSIVRMPDLSGNLPSFIFYGSIMSEFLRIARCTKLIFDFLPRAKSLVDNGISRWKQTFSSETNKKKQYLDILNHFINSVFLLNRSLKNHLDIFYN